MPYKSKSQMRAFFAMEARDELPKGTARRWAHHTKSIKKLPEHVQEKKSHSLAALMIGRILGKQASCPSHNSPPATPHAILTIIRGEQNHLDGQSWQSNGVKRAGESEQTPQIEPGVYGSSLPGLPGLASGEGRDAVENRTSEAQPLSRVAVKVAEMRRWLFLTGSHRPSLAEFPKLSTKLAFTPPAPPLGANFNASAGASYPQPATNSGPLDPLAQAPVVQAARDQLTQMAAPTTAPVAPLTPPPGKPAPVGPANTPSSNPIGLMSGISTDPMNVNGNAAFGTQNNVVKVGGVLIRW